MGEANDSIPFTIYQGRAARLELALTNQNDDSEDLSQATESVVRIIRTTTPRTVLYEQVNGLDIGQALIYAELTAEQTQLLATGVVIVAGAVLIDGNWYECDPVYAMVVPSLTGD